MNEQERPNLITVAHFCAKYPWPSEAGLRWLIFNAKTNGCAKCLIRIGRRVLIDEKAFFEWAHDSNRASLRDPDHKIRLVVIDQIERNCQKIEQALEQSLKLLQQVKELDERIKNCLKSEQ